MNEPDDTSPEQALAVVLKRYVALEDDVMSQLTRELETIPSLDEKRRAAAKEKILQKLELHGRADALIEEAVARYREDLYFVSGRLADDDGEAGVVTRAHVRQAQTILARRRRSYSWGDAILAFGGLLLGTALPHLIDLAQATPVAPRMTLIACGVAGALLLGMGVVEKAKT